MSGGSGFIRRYTSDPGTSTITEIEGVVIIEEQPPPIITGTGTGMVTIVGEFEDGPFNTPYQVTNSVDFQKTFGTFGYNQPVYNISNYGIGYKQISNKSIVNYPCACYRQADQLPEYWNGNGFIALTQKTFSALTVIRVDTTVGTVEFSPCAVITSAPGPTFNMNNPEMIIFMGTHWLSPIILEFTQGNAVTFEDIATVAFQQQEDLPVPYLQISQNNDGSISFTNLFDGAAGTLTVISYTGTVLGLVTGQTASATSVNGVIPAGTPISNLRTDMSRAGVVTASLVTAQSVKVTANNNGPYIVPVRPAIDNGSYEGIDPWNIDYGNVTALTKPIPGLGIWLVKNPLPIGAALTEEQIDVNYQTAIAASENVSNVVSKTNIIFSARQSNVIRHTLENDAIFASSEGCYGRMSIIRPPLGSTTRLMATSESVSDYPMSVCNYRSKRTIYTYPGVRVNISQIQALGTSGGIGFTSDGNIDVGADSWLACIMSNLDPEENPGQTTDYADAVIGIESGNPDVQVLGMQDYINFKTAGICAPRMVNGTCIFESGVTSVDPNVYFNLRNIARQRMADYIEDSLAAVMNQYIKKLSF